jgi:hypothetical protein
MSLPCDFWSVDLILLFPVDIPQFEKLIPVVEALRQRFEILFRVAGDHGSSSLAPAQKDVASARASIFAVLLKGSVQLPPLADAIDGPAGVAPMTGRQVLWATGGRGGTKKSTFARFDEAVGARLRSTLSLPRQSSTTSTHGLDSLTCWPACRITPPSANHELLPWNWRPRNVAHAA